MSIEYTWHCNEMKVLPTLGDLKDVVAFVSWHLNGTDGTFQENQYGEVAVSAAVLDEFIDFPDLTLTEVIGWVQKELGEDTVKSLQERIAASINNRAHPPFTVIKAPWVIHDEILVPAAPAAPVEPEPAAPVEPEPAASVGE